MPGYVLIVDFFGAVLAVTGFAMAFCQPAVRRLIGRPQPPVPPIAGESGADPLTYVLRIAGVMVMVFGVVIAGMITLFNLS